MSSHTCPAPGCAVQVPDSMLACRTHWFSLAKPLRDAVWSAYNGPGVGSPEHRAAIDACVAALRSVAGDDRPARQLAPDELVRMAYHVPDDIPVALPPAFLLAGEYAHMWAAWRKLQAAGEGDELGRGWRVYYGPANDGAKALRLEVYFVPAR